MPSCVIIVENLPVPLDRRVWQEAVALRDAGWKVSVICPSTSQHPEYFERLEGVDIFRHPLPVEGRGAAGFLLEYSLALFHEFRLLLKIAFRGGFDVIHACNPPDLIFLVAAPFKIFGKKFVFDHHDVSPELFEAKFAKRGFFHSLLLFMERRSFQAADVVISANETYRELAIDRGGKDPGDVITVYSVPDRSRVRRVPQAPALRQDARLVLGYIGIIGDQDGVDHLVRCMHQLCIVEKRTDIRAAIVGDGPALGTVRALAQELGVADRITFTGYLKGEALLTAMSTFDIGVIPDPVNQYNDKISMNKVFEYSALGIPPVAYRLTETRRLLGGIGTFAEDDTPAGLAQACALLIDDEELRLSKGAAAKAHADAQFDWAREADKLVSAYARLVPAHKSLTALDDSRSA